MPRHVWCVYGRLDQVETEDMPWWLHCEYEVDHADDSYLLNPYTLLSCLSRSTVVFDNALTLSAIAFAAEGKPWS
jgi:hypothetical protein